MNWIQVTLLGSIATAIAIIAVALVGLMAATSRVDLRRGATVIIGCFIIFDATAIAAGLRSAAETGLTTCFGRPI